MKTNLISIILVGLVVLNILDGSFQEPSAFDYVKFVLLAAALILSIIKARRK
ncbi:hypothetical protein HYG86_09045 [Alkalicella caledoniensis]|uniref:Uncharacterized protein n=1 Tax=Alkalicella caledoniensis TaxID=2731377 RepID=A0A7G9W896_ALKCA|nr:hypothetical protein [Alkalicella caledoniensis]QNO14908.1 hypothetical protein HYG86_09045 [Alkalicella caledoniensis]